MIIDSEITGNLFKVRMNHFHKFVSVEAVELTKSTFCQVSGIQPSIMYRAVAGFIWRCGLLKRDGGHYIQYISFPYTGLVVATNYVMGLVLVETVKHLELAVIKCSTLPGAGGHYVQYLSLYRAGGGYKLYYGDSAGRNSQNIWSWWSPNVVHYLELVAIM